MPTSKKKLFDYVLDFWMEGFLLNDGNVLKREGFTTDDTERLKVSEFLTTVNSLSELKRCVYNNGFIDNKNYLDERYSVHDKLTFFTLAYICNIFWILEDNPEPLIEEKKLDFIPKIREIGNALENSKSDVIVKNFLDIIKIINNFDSENRKKPFIDDVIPISPVNKTMGLQSDYAKKLLTYLKISISDFNTHYLFNDNQELGDRLIDYIYHKSEEHKLANKPIKLQANDCKKLLGDLKISINDFNMYDLFNENQELVNLLVDNIYYKFEENKCLTIIGLERSGIPLASLVAYKFGINLQIMRTVPEIKLLPCEPIGSSLIFDDLSITGTTFALASEYLTNKFGSKFKNRTKLVLMKDSQIKDISSLLVTKDLTSNNIVESHIKCISYKPLTRPNICENDLKLQIKKSCVNSNYWNSEYTYLNNLFIPVCEQLMTKVKATLKEKDIKKSLIISISTFGLPFSSVISHELNIPLYLFSRRPTLMLNFTQKGIKGIKKALIEGCKNVIFIDDAYISGTTEKIAEKRVKDIAKDINIQLNFHKFVVAFLGKNKPENLSCIVDINYLIS
ncbi:phosphoribosyltransferase [Methanosarcina sp.]|uniref:phosphoribosyltransferase n=1 Tax=Methanosarcina sp. TaxID=2213 RepID=UPI002988CEE0|nr:phosphoribosyltransferase [Methanosarcina sp.]MDW5548977.1 phosphoribosyltransferase [Methanosarcina sp.]MDW5552680.1 phosphoribosyltransferase [Methanosarcina sp.]MDW5559236.1 phosphoribosyltransferase [Methanosarcina sp.]